MIIRVSFIFIIFIYLCIWVRFREKLRFLDIITIVFFLIYIYLLLSLTLFSRTEFNDVEVSLNPFYSYYGILTKGWNGEGYYIAQSLLGNVILFLPVGILLYEPLKKVRAKAFIVLTVSFLLSLCIEMVQYMYGIGTFEIDDLIHNTLGGVFGVLLAESSVLFKHFNKESLRCVAKKLTPLLVFCCVFFLVCIVSIIRLWAVQSR